MILHRLMKKLEDGSFEVVGYEDHLEDGAIVQWNGHDKRGRKTVIWSAGHRFGMLESYKIKHFVKADRKDRFTEITLNDEAKTKVFERDEIETYLTPHTITEKYSFKILWCEACGGWGLILKNTNDYCFNCEENVKWTELIRNIHQTKIIGIHGVKEAV